MTILQDSEVRLETRTDLNGFTDSLIARGWADPLKLLGGTALQEVQDHLKLIRQDNAAAWSKDLAVRDRLVFDLASDERILERLKPLLGEDIILWGASLVQRVPGQAHPWHSDLEVWNASERDAISVWIGIEGTCAQTSLQLISGTHKLGISVQEAAQHLARAERTGANLLAIAQQAMASPALETAACQDGEAAFFVGSTWHGTLNTTDLPRTALLLQYARAGWAVRQPDWSQLDWPFKFEEHPRPPVISIQGATDLSSGNHFVPPPASSPQSMWNPQEKLCELKPLKAAIPSPMPVAAGKGWSPTRFFEGFTSDLRKISCHASTLQPGHCPHPPHGHFEEEILMVLGGEGEILWARDGQDDSPEVIPCGPGDLFFYPAFTYHTIRNPEAHEQPLEYLMFRWASVPDFTRTPLTRERWTSIFKDRTTAKGFESELLFEGPTRHLNKIHAHLSSVEPGAGYPAHADDYDVAIVLQKGKIRTLGKVVEAPAVLFHPTGTLHGLEAVGDEPAHYVVVEFHGTPEERPAATGGFLRRILAQGRKLFR